MAMRWACAVRPTAAAGCSSIRAAPASGPRTSRKSARWSSRAKSTWRVDELRWLVGDAASSSRPTRCWASWRWRRTTSRLARGHFGFAVQLGLKALQRAKVTGPLPYSQPANRAFFEAGRGLVMSLVKLGLIDKAVALVQDLVRLDPGDPLRAPGADRRSPHRRLADRRAGVTPFPRMSWRRRLRLAPRAAGEKQIAEAPAAVLVRFGRFEPAEWPLCGACSRPPDRARRQSPLCRTRSAGPPRIAACGRGRLPRRGRRPLATTSARRTSPTNSCTPSNQVCGDCLNLKNTPRPSANVPLTTIGRFGGTRFTFSVASFDFDMPAETDGPTSHDTGPTGTGSLPLSVAPSERSLIVLLMVSTAIASAASSVAGEKLSTRMPAGGAVDLEVEMLDLADREALEADRDRQLHFDEPFVRRALAPFGGRDVAIFHEPREIEAHVLAKCEHGPRCRQRQCERRSAIGRRLTPCRCQIREERGHFIILREDNDSRAGDRDRSCQQNTPGRRASKSRFEHPESRRPG